MIRSVCLLLVAVILSLLTACALPDFGAFLKDPNQEEIASSAEQIVLQWDPPAETVSHFDVYYRNHGVSIWQVMGSVDSVPQPEYTVAHSTLGNGRYDFAVVAVNGEGAGG